MVRLFSFRFVADTGGIGKDSSLGVDTVHDLGEEETISRIESFFSRKDVGDGDEVETGVCRQFKKYACSAE